MIFSQIALSGFLYPNIVRCRPRLLHTITPNTISPSVAILWDLTNSKPPPDTPLHTAAIRLKLAAARFGTVRFSFAFHDHNKRQVSPSLFSPTTPNLCLVCGRKFSDRVTLLNHFKNIHERENGKRLSRLDSTKGAKRANLAAKLSDKISKYKKAAAEVKAVSAAVSSDHFAVLRREGFRILKGEAGLVRNDLLKMINCGGIGCIMLASDDLGFREVLREARAMGIRTVVVGGSDGGDGNKSVELRRCADAGFLWREVVSGKARDTSVTVVRRWKDRDLLERLEWRYEDSNQKKDHTNDGDDFIH